MASWVSIIMLWSNNGWAAVDHVYFETQAQCEAARSFAAGQAGETYPHAACFNALSKQVSQ